MYAVQYGQQCRCGRLRYQTPRDGRSGLGQGYVSQIASSVPSIFCVCPPSISEVALLYFVSPAPNIADSSSQSVLILNSQSRSVNARGAFLGSKHAIAQFLSQDADANGERGTIINMSSAGGIVGLFECCTHPFLPTDFVRAEEIVRNWSR